MAIDLDATSTGADTHRLPCIASTDRAGSDHYADWRRKLQIVNARLTCLYVAIDVETIPISEDTHRLLCIAFTDRSGSDHCAGWKRMFADRIRIVGVSIGCHRFGNDLYRCEYNTVVVHSLHRSFSVRPLYSWKAMYADRICTDEVSIGCYNSGYDLAAISVGADAP